MVCVATLAKNNEWVCNACHVVYYSSHAHAIIIYILISPFCKSNNENEVSSSQVKRQAREEKIRMMIIEDAKKMDCVTDIEKIDSKGPQSSAKTIPNTNHN